MENQKIILIGPPGAGKTTLAQALATRLKLPFLDLDRQIEQQVGLSVPDIFRIHGESFFRIWEQSLLTQILLKEVCFVLALGAGATNHPANKELLQQGTIILHLDISPQKAMQRLCTDISRPLLNSPYTSLKEKIEEYKRLDNSRRETRFQIQNLYVLNEDKSFEDLLEKSICLLENDNLEKRKINLSAKSQNLFENLSFVNLKEITEFLNSRKEKRIFVDPEVSRLYPKIPFLKNAHVLDARGDLKNKETLQIVLDQVLKMSRGGWVIAIGGGALLDVVAFAASIAKRGMKLCLIPTTLLAMVDATLGGKTAIDHQLMRNAIGTFYPAHQIFLDLNFLQTLQQREWNCGKAEMLKHALLGAAHSVESVLNLSVNTLKNVGGSKILEQDIKASLELKQQFVAGDLEDRNKRQALNLGHTIAHAIEKIDAVFLHGEAVLIGLWVILKYSKKFYQLEECVFTEEVRCIKKLLLSEEFTGLKLSLPTWESVEKVLHTDKKMLSDAIILVLLKKQADFSLVKADLQLLEKCYRQIVDEFAKTVLDSLKM